MKTMTKQQQIRDEITDKDIDEIAQELGIADELNKIENEDKIYWYLKYSDFIKIH
jgi:parvulin-like peptidyl-prolyl isomerase